MTIILIDQYPLQRMGLAQFLGNRFGQYSILEFDNLNNFCDHYTGENPALIIWGIGNTDLKSGFDWLSILRRRLLMPAIVICDEKADPQKALRYLKAGAAGYFSKSDDLSRLADGLDDVLRGKRYVTKQVLSAILEKQLFPTNEPKNGPKMLSKGEREVAAYLVRGMKVSTIASLLDKKMSTVSTYKHRIFKKLEVDNVIDLKEKLKSLT